MRIAYVAGNFNQSYATEVHLARELVGLGHQVRKIPETCTVAAIERQAADADLLIYTRSHGLSPEATQAWRHLEANGTKTISIHLDLYAGLVRLAEVGNNPMWHVQTVFTADGDPTFTDYCASLGIDHRWMPPAIVSNEAVPGRRRDEYVSDVVFVGHAGSYHPEWPWRMELLAFLRARYGERFRVHEHFPGIRGLALNDLYASATVVVGDSLALPGRRGYFSDRYFETVGRGGFLLGPYVPGIERFLTDNLHCRFYDVGDTDQLGKAIDFYLSEPAKAREIANRGQAHVREHHTYRHRMERVVREIMGA